MTRRGSHCSKNGHDWQTFTTRGGGGAGLKLFGVRLTDGSIVKKSASMGNLSALHCQSSSSAAASPNLDSPSSDLVRDPALLTDGYMSDGPAHGSGSSNRRSERKKGLPWTEEEHRRFLIGLQKLGKGDWRGIARNYVMSRTPTQVASHAQKYFIRQSNANRRKRRSSLFDMVANDAATDTPAVPEEQVLLPSPLPRESDNTSSLASLNLTLNTELEPMEATCKESVKEPEEQLISCSNEFTSMVPSFYTAYIPVPYPFWLHYTASGEENKGAGTSCNHPILKPTPVLPKETVNVDQLVLSQLSLGDTKRGFQEPSPLSLKLLGGPLRQSAFHVNTPVSGSDLRIGETSPIQAV